MSHRKEDTEFQLPSEVRQLGGSMKRSGLAILALCGLITCAHAQDKKAMFTQAVNNFSHESLVCGVYFTIAAQCIENRGDGESKAFASKMRELGGTAFKQANDTGNIIGITEKAQMARLQMAMQDLKADINENCVNTSVLLQKYGQLCKRTVETGMEDLEKKIRPLTGQ